MSITLYSGLNFSETGSGLDQNTQIRILGPADMPDRNLIDKIHVGLPAKGELPLYFAVAIF